MQIFSSSKRRRTGKGKLRRQCSSGARRLRARPQVIATRELLPPLPANWQVENWGKEKHKPPNKQRERENKRGGKIKYRFTLKAADLKKQRSVRTAPLIDVLKREGRATTFIKFHAPSRKLSSFQSIFSADLAAVVRNKN